MQKAKRCNRCQKTKDADSFSISQKSKDGLKNWCRACVSAYYSENKARIDEKNRVYREANKEKLREYFKEYCKKNKEKITAKNKAAYAIDPEKYKCKSRIREKEKREQIRQAQKRWREANPDRFKSIQKKWKAKNRETLRANFNRYRARKLGAKGSYTKADILRMWSLQNGRCACCKVHLCSKYHADHILPLAKGGSNEARNIQLLCPTCNGRKGAKDPIQFMQEQGFLL